MNHDEAIKNAIDAADKATNKASAAEQAGTVNSVRGAELWAGVSMAWSAVAEQLPLTDFSMDEGAPAGQPGFITLDHETYKVMRTIMALFHSDGIGKGTRPFISQAMIDHYATTNYRIVKNDGGAGPDYWTVTNR